MQFLKDKLDFGNLKDGFLRLDGSSNGQQRGLVAEESFTRMLCLERKRAERSRKRFVLMVLDAGQALQTDRREELLSKIVSALSSSIRETDISGWYRDPSAIGVIFTELNGADSESVLRAIWAKVVVGLRNNLDLEQVNGIHISFHVFPEDWDKQSPGRPADFRLYPDLTEQDGSKKLSRFVKRTIDIVGSLLALIVLSPLFAVISLLIKLTSEGPILFRQKRLGQYGAEFTFLKFRSMYSESDPSIHQDYVSRFISGKADLAGPEETQHGVYKITEDPRVTPIGKFIRRTSLDELPQFLNVLQGEMSLVGPRPPIPYEFDAYDVWHRRRVLEVKPGITGLWQVSGRSKTTFDGMVRLDLRYARTWSLWLDIRILLQTPLAVLSGEGAY